MKRTRGRPRSFDEESVKTAIMRTFWEKGFAAASLDDLSHATGLTRPSLYGAFGDKLSMYLMTMDLFGEMMREAAGRGLSQGNTLSESLTGFYKEAIKIYFGDDGAQPFGCLVFTTAGTEAISQPKIKEAVRRQLALLDKGLRQRIALLCPDIPKAKLDIAVSLSASALHSIGLRARAGVPRSELHALARRTVLGIETFCRE